MIFACIDTETTGFLSDPSAHVIEVAAVLYDSEADCVVDSFAALVNPPVLTQDGLAVAKRVSQLDESQIRAGLPPEVAWSRVARLVAAYPITAWNVEFDRKFCRRTFLGFEEREVKTLVDATHWDECACERFTELYKAVAGTRVCPDTGEVQARYISLARAAWLCGFQWEGTAHRALADAKMAAKIYAGMVSGRIKSLVEVA
jgi:DNA polymerase III epsilon subunit-like protein